MAKPRSEINRDYFLRLKAAGMSKVSVWLTPQAKRALTRLAQKHGSQDAAIEAAIAAACSRGEHSDA